MGRGRRRHQLGIGLRGDHLRLLIEADHRRIGLTNHPFIVASGAVDIGQDVAAIGVHGNKHIGLCGAGQHKETQQSGGECLHCYTSPFRPRKLGVLPQWPVVHQPYASTVP
ncbi:hypothetical protein D3C79_948920 [compost metagenome]